MTSPGFPASQVPPTFTSGSRIAGYLLEEQIGEGGMAVVFRAHDERLSRKVALKILAPALAADEGFRRRFIRESRAAAAVDDPHIIPVFEASEAEGVLFIAMRLVRGGDVRDLLDSHGMLPAERAADIISQAASALDAAHGRGLVHRDVKPANMLLDQRASNSEPDHVYLSDFGLSKASMHATGLTRSGMVLGTLDYISPEQIEGKPVDGRADQYSLACAAYELLSGMPPFRRDDPMAMMYAHLHAAPPPLSSSRPGLDVEADEVVARALAKHPADRYDNCKQFSAALSRALGVSAGPSASGPGAGHPATMAASPPPPAAGPVTETATPRWPPGQIQRDPIAGGMTGGAAQSSPARRRLPPAALIGACVLAAAGIVSGATLLRSQGHSPGAASSSPPGQTASQSSSPHAGSSSPVASSQGQQGTQTSAAVRFQPLATLYPGASTVSISSVAWTGTGSLVAASDKNGSTYLWSAGTFHRQGPALAGPAAAYTTAFSPNGAIVATGYLHGSTYLWSTATGRLLTRLKDPGNTSTAEVDTLAFSPDSQTLATADGNGYTNLWNVGNGRDANLRISLRDPAGAGVYSVAFSSQGTLATGDYVGHVYLWNVAAGSVTATFVVPAGYCKVTTHICDAASGLAFSSDGSLLAAANLSGNAELWSVTQGRGVSLPTGSQGGAAIWAMSFGDHDLAMACSDGYAYFWHVSQTGLKAAPAGSVADPRTGGDGIGAVAFGASGRLLATGDTNGSVYLWKLG